MSISTAKVPHPIPYQGSKRGLANIILSYFPKGVNRLFEPFAGSAAISLAAAFHQKASAFHLNDANVPLMGLWAEILDNPLALSAAYAQIWNQQLDDPRSHYDLIRAQFNKTREPGHLLYLLARCVKASVRYNANGEFNQSPDNRRLGTVPATMKHNLCGASALLKGKCVVSRGDYAQALGMATPGDLVYLDPPYQGVCGERDQRYAEKIAHHDFLDILADMNNGDISYIVSYDGRTGLKEFGMAMPASLQLQHIEVKAGRSTQSTLLGRDDDTYESLYLSPALFARLPRQCAEKPTTASLLEAAA